MKWALAYNVANVESKASARLIQEFYKIPNSHMIPLSCPSSRFIDRDEYNSQIEEPLRGKLEELVDVKYLILAKGLPLQITGENNMALSKPQLFYQQDGASLESELLDIFSPLGLKSGWRERFGKKSEIKSRGLFVSRLDGKDVIDIQMKLENQKNEKAIPFKKFVFVLDSVLEKDSKLEPIIYSAKQAISFLDSLQLDFKVGYQYFGKNYSPEELEKDSATIVWFLTKRCINQWPDNWKNFSIYQFAHSGQIEYPACFSQIANSSKQTGNWVGLLGPSPASVFPLPHEFLAYLLSGNYPLGDIWNEILYFSSWQLNLSFNPVWNPFEKTKLLELDQMEKLLELGRVPQ